ncbi:hypothetical protein [Methyloceanibacter sp.]|uniref:hypothetical protein n=1 Tax=Methyloceanibacter sp. TaxID=1965321 RepID=UPI002D3FFDD1|nr:hypothetical protein [Methyloceanibacter sp.]HZP10694.1 hypothetical protein [Methyloceanibacter sp.]
MKNIDRWFILIGLLFGISGFAFGIWVGVSEHFELAPVHAHINLVGFASMVLFGLMYRAYPALAESKLAAAHFVIFPSARSCSSRAYRSRKRTRPSRSP